MDRHNHEGVSCASRDLYTKEEWRDPHISFERIHEVSDPAKSNFEILHPVFARSSVTRPMPKSMAGPSSDDIDETLRHYQDINNRHISSSPSYLIRIGTAIIWRNMVFVQSGDDIIPVYENFRIIDRQEKGTNLVEELKSKNIQNVESDGASVIFFGSAGSFNYGHWLIDDFSRHSGLKYINTPVICIFSQMNGAIDGIRQEGMALAAGSHPCESRFVDPDVPLRVNGLLYVTPSSDHPFLKNPHAMNYVRDLGRGTVAPGAPTRRLFVNRADRWPRRLTNIADVSAILREHGFTEITTEGMSLHEQIEAFAQAEVVVGIMGASMTSTVFCKPGTPLLYLAPSGWQEPFFWDQAAMGGHAYHALFGTPDAADPHSLYQKSFSVDLNQLKDALAALAA